jgi:hypothetical protein
MKARMLPVAAGLRRPRATGCTSGGMVGRQKGLAQTLQLKLQ